MAIVRRTIMCASELALNSRKGAETEHQVQSIEWEEPAWAPSARRGWKSLR